MISASAPYPSKTVRRLAMAVFLPLWLVLLFIFTSANAQAETYQVLRVYDGDTITILNAGQKQSIRLVGIDTPEKSRKKNEPGQPYSQKATKFLI